jgi:aspartyl/glutamyl-tRNA(Asn/Gln) amidotransferase C subunit
MITTQDIENLAKLARIKIDEDEKSQLVKEIDSILTYIDQIKQATIAADGSGNGAVRNIMRSDTGRVISSEDRERILVEIPDRERDFVAVKKIL